MCTPTAWERSSAWLRLFGTLKNIPRYHGLVSVATTGIRLEAGRASTQNTTLIYHTSSRLSAWPIPSRKMHNREFFLFALLPVSRSLSPCVSLVPLLCIYLSLDVFTWSCGAPHPNVLAEQVSMQVAFTPSQTFTQKASQNKPTAMDKNQQ